MSSTKLNQWLESIKEKAAQIKGHENTQEAIKRSEELAREASAKAKELLGEARKSKQIMYVAKAAGLGALVGIVIGGLHGMAIGAVVGALIGGALLLYRHIIEIARPPKDLHTELTKLLDLLAKGAITQSEFAKQKKILIKTLSVGL